MAASFPGTTRARSWNVQIHADRESIAGIFQRDDLVTITDLAHELELCFILDKPDGDTTWQPALFPRDDYDLLVDYHGRKVDIPSDIDQRALQHHWDMCCLENIPSSLLPYSSAVVIDIPELRGPAINTSQGNPSKGAFPHASDSQVSATHKADTQASSTQASDTLTASDMQSLRLSSFLASASQACLPSPPPSKPSSEGQKLWRLGHKVIKDPARAVELWRQGHNIVAVESDTEGSDEERGRTHSPVQLPCVGAISSGQEETRGVVNGSKKQRLQ
ncbi:hypothetical protein VM1G_06443 [Cytospora mali]|uniref:Uncharacterized protein n=1 Tax=Cytospora mali TaxID=578113 RepID=A0A194W1Z9_CYTMA|nr:hypothetical protein VM1G_06443 [Valsa mali]